MSTCLISKVWVMALVSGDSWLEKGDNSLVFGPPGAARAISPPPLAFA